MKQTIYLDNAATTRTDPKVVEAMLPYFSEHFGNASAIYGIGSENREVIDRARATIANVLGAKENEIYFTAGGTESDNWEGLLDKSVGIIGMGTISAYLIRMLQVFI